jgi:molybdopterin converting factor small subunit
VRFGPPLAQLAQAPRLILELPDGATVAHLYDCLAAAQPELAPALRTALPMIGGAHAERRRVLADGDEVALLAPVVGG